MATNYEDTTWVERASPGISATQLNRIDGGMEALYQELDALVGAFIMYTAATAPSPKWLICDGATVSKTTYAALWALVGHTYATDPGGGNFTLPDFRGRLPVGLAPTTTALNTLGKTAGTWDHHHAQSNHQHAGGDHTHSIPSSDSSGGPHSHTNTSTGSSGHGHTISGSITSGGVHSHSNPDNTSTPTTSVGSRIGRDDYFVSRPIHTHSLNDTETAGAHTHANSLSVSDASGHTHTTSTTGESGTAHTHNTTANTGAGSAGNPTDGGGDNTGTGNPPVLVVNFLIRALA